MPLRPPAPRFRVEPLEDRTTPDVTAAFAAGTLTVTLGAAGDTAVVTGTASGGTDLEVTGTGIVTPQDFPGVTAVVVVDNGANVGQTVEFRNAAAPADAVIQLPGAITVNGVETVTVETVNGPLQALSVGINGASTAVNLRSPVTTTGSAGQLYGGPVTVGNGAATDITVTASGGGGVEFVNTVNGSAADGNNLTVNAAGATKFDGAIGGLIRLAGIDTDAPGTTVIAANVTTQNEQTYRDPVTIAGASVVFASNAKSVEFQGTVNGQSAGVNGIVVNAETTTRFGAAVGGTTALASITVNPGIDPQNPGTTEIGGNVTTDRTGAQLYGEPVVVTGPAVTLTSGTGSISFTSTLSATAADTTDVTVNTGGTTTFSADVGATRLKSLTTDAAGSVVFGAGGAAVAVTTSGAQAFNDAARLNAAVSTFTTTATGAITFGGTLNGTTAGTAGITVTTAGDTTFGGVVGGTATLSGITTDAPGTTVLKASLSTTGAQLYNDPVTLNPVAGGSAVIASTTNGNVTFGGTIGGTTSVPFTAQATGNVAVGGPITVSGASFAFTAQASGNVTLGGNVTLAGAGSAFTARAGTSGTGVITIPAGTTIRADSQTYRAGDGPGTLTTATVNLLANTPQLRNAAGDASPVAFTLRQDEAITDATLPAAAQFGGTFPKSVTLVSDDGALTLNSTTIAGPLTTDVLLSARQAVTVGTAINAPVGVVRLNSTTAGVTQAAAGTITASTLGVRAASAIDLSAAPNAATSVALQSTTGAVSYATAVPTTVVSVTADPQTGVFTGATGIQAGGAAVTVSPAGTTALDLTVAAPLAGSSVAVTGGTGADRLTVNYSLGATLANGLTFTGGGGTDTLLLTDVGATAAHTYVVNGTVVRDSGQPVTLAGVENLSVTGGNGADAFTVTPDATYTVTVAGNAPSAPQTTSDTLTVTLTGASNPVLSTTKTNSGLQGTASFSDKATVSFSGIESLTPSTDVKVTATTSATIGSGSTGTITVTVTNAGPAAVTGLSLVDNFPAGLSATWTAEASSGSFVAAVSGAGDINTTANLAVNGTVTFTITLTAAGSARGTLTNTFTAGSSANAFELDPSNNSAATTVTTGATDIFAVGAGAGGGPAIAAFNADGTERFRKFAYDPSYTGGVTIATGDVTGDGFEDVVTGSATGATHVKVFDGRTGAEVASFFAFPGFTGGVNVAVAGGRIIAGAGVGGGPIVAVYSMSNGAATEVTRFFAFESTFRGGVQVGGSDKFIAVGAGPGGGPHVKLYDATTLAETQSFYAFPQGSTDGVSVALGGTTATPTLLVGSGLGSTPVAVTYNATTAQQLGSFQAFETAFKGGVRVAPGPLNNNLPTTVVAPGPGGSTRVRVLASDNTVVRDFFAFESTFTGGVFVG